MRIFIALALLLPAACNGGVSSNREPATTSQSKPTTASKIVTESGMCEQDPECQKDLTRFIAGQQVPEVDILGEIAEYFSRNAATPEEDTRYHEIKTIAVPGAAQSLQLWATNRIGSGACFSVKLVNAGTGKIAWNEEGLCDVRVLGITDAGTLIKIAAKPSPGESHAAPHRLQVTYYAWDASAGAFQKIKSLETRARM